MRDIRLFNKIEYSNTEDVSIISIEYLPTFDIEDYDLLDEKDYKKYIFDIERICRSSMEYRNLIKFLKDNMEMNKCSIFENVTNIETYKIKIEIHHEPFSLFDIATIVYNKRLALNEPLDVELVAKEVMALHYNLLIGLIPLSETVHELVHNNYLFLPLNKVLGNVETFYNLYYDYIPVELRDLYERNREYSESFDESLQMGVLQRKYVYIDPTGAYNLPNYEEIVNIMEEKIKQLKEKNTPKPLIEPFKVINKDIK